MAFGTVQSTTLPPPPPAPLESRERERMIRRQLARTGLQVRLVDLASSLAIWVIGVVVLFLLLALFDHVLGLGRVGRCVALAMLLGGSLWYLVMQVGPLLVRAINPAYSARTIEETKPTLKNSLINFLLLRDDRSGLKEIVYQAVEQQAAVDIATVNIDTTVDRSRLIYAGYVLCGVMGLLAVYKILSPKDPFQTVARVLAPWADIARPSRVQISEVQPGSAEVYHGQTVRISATIRGAREGERIAVLYSTVDGQTINQAIAMKLSAGDRYEGDLPAETSGSATAGGLLQNATYRIVAGDAESFEYRLNVISAPTIVVDRLNFQFPGYTKKAADSLAQQGDIKALEGTKVTIHAVANQPIKSAWIEFDPAANEAAAETVPLIADGERARGTITLQLKADRQTSWHATYQVRYYNERGQRSQQPILHRIEVIRDLPPEVQILKPERMRVEVPEDREQTIEVRAVDPDFGLAGLRIEGGANGKPPVSIDLLKDAANQPPQITVPFAFRPREHHLKAGDEFRYVAVADDNRTNAQTGQPEPNSTRTKEYSLVITAPKNSGGGQGGQGGGDQKPKPDGKNQNQPGAGQQKPDQKSKPDQRNQEQPQQPMNGDGQKNQDQTGKQDQQKNQEQKQDGQKGDQQNKQQNGQQSGDDSKQQGDQKQGNQQSGEQKSGDQQKSDQQNQSQQGGQQQGGEQQSGQKQDGQQQGGQQQKGQADEGQQNNQSGGGQKGQSGSKGGNDSQEQGDPSGGGQPSNTAGQGGKSGKSSDGSQQSGGQPGDRQGEPSGDQGKAQHDGQAIERIWKEMQKRGETQKQDGQSQEGANKSQDGNQQAGEQQGGEKAAGDKTQGQSPPGSKENGDKTQQPGGQQGGQPQAAGSSGAAGKSNSNTGMPEGNDQKQKAKGNDPAGKGKADKTGDRLPDEQQGQNPSEQPSGGSKGGESHGGSKTDKGEKSPATQGEQRDSGAGKTGEEGAGQASEDKSGSGDGNFKNRDHDKEQKPDGNKAEKKGEPSPANSSNRQSDSKGANSGENSGGGKQGGGQSAQQPGNDSAGSQTAGDMGAGKAEEKGGGETGSKAGEQQKAAGKTGKSGDEAGEGSAARGGNDPGAAGAKADQQPKGEGGDAKKKSDSDLRAKGDNRGSDPVGGKDDNQERFQNKTEAGEGQEADAANLEYARKATEMVLKRLKDEQHNPDPELLDKLGWSRDDLAEFLRRWDSLQKSAKESPTGRHELDEALQSLGLRDPASKKRAGGKTSDSQRDLRDAGNRSAPPPRYRDMFDAFRKGSARSTP